ncbi:hypothetical protein PENANT_c010G08345 [Penicillium antarcticum]|uniref:Uncharacterized protein n=1 Tax=Penicillium antarcticum TaxID=416450 RepID=A0A1V6Q7R8_9EURO|nr:hypothetical protein PENANT_c010G08345 [Penicillium antarcticum]
MAFSASAVVESHGDEYNHEVTNLNLQITEARSNLMQSEAHTIFLYHPIVRETP